MKEKYFDWVKILAAVGIILAVYLLYNQIFKPAYRVCTISSTVNCDAIIEGPVAKTLGIPTPLIGLAGYVFILYGAIKKMPKLVWGMATFGLAFCLYIAYIELVQLKVVCPVCILCQLDMITVFILGYLLNKKS